MWAAGVRWNEDPGASLRGHLMPRRPVRALMSAGTSIVELRFTQEFADGSRILPPKPRKHPDTHVRLFSERSRRSLRKACLRFPWSELGYIAMVTLTYPGHGPHPAEVSGRVVKRDLEVFCLRWRRHFGSDIRGIWAMEFQERGVPHLHFFVGLPKGVDYDDLRGWGFVVWSEIAGFDSCYGPVDLEHHWRMHLRFNVSPAWFAPGRADVSVADYLWRESGKWRQKDVPSHFVDLGRFWGVRGGGPKGPEYELCCPGAGFKVRRVMFDLSARRRHGKKHRPYRAVRGGGYTVAFDGAATLQRLYVWALGECGCRQSRILLALPMTPVSMGSR